MEVEVAEEHINAITIDSYVGRTWNTQIVQSHVVKHWIEFFVVVPPLQWILHILNRMA